MKLIIAGTRTFDDIHRMNDVICDNFDLEKIVEIVSGGAQGADNIGEIWAEVYKIPVKIFAPSWSSHGRAAGPLRNAQMAEYADAACIFWDGKSTGTANMIINMQKVNKPCFIDHYLT